MSRQQVPNVELRSDTARANLLTNGGFEVWQRGNGPFTTASAWGPDGWILGLNAPDTLSVSRDSANADTGSQYCAVVVHTGTVGSNLQARPTDSAQLLRGRTITASVRVKTSTASAVRLTINDGVTGPINGAFHSGSGTYETLTLTYAVAANPSTLVINVAFLIACTAYVDNAMLVVGSVAADYAPLHPADDLARCLRYYEILGESLNELSRTWNSTGASQLDDATFAYHVRKAVSPTITKIGASWPTGSTGQPVVVTGGLNSIVLRSTTSGAGTASWSNNAAGCNITVESNP